MGFPSVVCGFAMGLGFCCVVFVFAVVVDWVWW